MVTINFTIIILLAMFLGFLWIMHRFVFKPVLALMDAREEKMAEDRAMAQDAATEAAHLEDEYASRLAAIHREANLRITRARRESQEEHIAKVDAFRKRAEADLRKLREAIDSDIDSQRDQFDGLAHDVAIAMKNHLELE